MSPLWLIALVPPLVADPAPPLIVASASPRGVTPALSSAALLSAVERATPSPLVVRTPEQVGLDVNALLECPLDRRLLCWTERTAAAAADAVLLVVSMVEGAEGTTYTGVLVDVRIEGASSDRSENAIYARAPRFDRSGVRRDGLAAALQADVARALATLVAQRDDLVPWGEVELAARAGRTVRVDGRAVGVTRDTTAIRLRPGSRRIALDEGEIERVVEVPSAGRVHLDLTQTASHPLHSVSAWAGAGVGALGAAVLVTAAATNSGRQYSWGAPPAANGWTDSCDLFGGCSDGVPLAPLGAALLGAGATAALTYGFVADGEDYEWWWSALAAGLGVVTYGVMAVAN